MKSSRFVLLLILVLAVFLSSCQDGSQANPTPFPTVPLTMVSQTGEPVTLTLTELVANPGLYKDEVVIVSGRFKRQPLLVCDTEPQPSPATWALVEEGVSIDADGPDQQVRSLLPEDLTMTAQGRWRLWTGLVGCGKQAQEQQVWYLDVARIISPSPLTQATLTPEGFAVAEAESDQQATAPAESGAETQETVSPEMTEVAPTAAAQATPPAGQTPSPSGNTNGVAGSSPTATVTQQTLQVTPLATESVTATVAGTAGGTATATPQVTPGTPTVTPAGGATPTSSAGLATPTPGSGEVVQIGDLFDLDEEIGMATLPANRIHSYTIEIFEDEAFSVSVIAPVPADLVLSARLNGETLVDRQNLAPAGATESLDTSQLTQEGTYEIWVATENGAATEYAIVAYFEDDFVIVFNGFLTPGQPRSNVNSGLDETHYWFFNGTAGQNVRISLTTGSANDGLIDIYGPGGEYFDSVDDGFEGEDEVYSFSLPATGLYAFAISDIDYEPMTYTVELTLE